ncbi:MAG: hypothetical protein HC843_08595 [Sphingomonadales bacterium]|nr:hypothetical protein [Sphingomonadales bacterium]
MKEKFRYRLFYRLIDFAFAMNILLLLDMLYEVFVDSNMDYGVFAPVALGIVVLAICIPSFLIFARFMHDEYIRLLWQKPLKPLSAP